MNIVLQSDPKRLVYFKSVLEPTMIYALTTHIVSENERREIAQALARSEDPPHQSKLIHVCHADYGYSGYFCIYCIRSVHRHGDKGSHCFHHDRYGDPDGPGCIGTDKWLPGIMNPTSITCDC